MEEKNYLVVLPNKVSYYSVVNIENNLNKFPPGTIFVKIG